MADSVEKLFSCDAGCSLIQSPQQAQLTIMMGHRKVQPSVVRGKFFMSPGNTQPSPVIRGVSLNTIITVIGSIDEAGNRVFRRSASLFGGHTHENDGHAYRNRKAGNFRFGCRLVCPAKRFYRGAWLSRRKMPSAIDTPIRVNTSPTGTAWGFGKVASG